MRFHFGFIYGQQMVTAAFEDCSLEDLGARMVKKTMADRELREAEGVQLEMIDQQGIGILLISRPRLINELADFTATDDLEAMKRQMARATLFCQAERIAQNAWAQALNQIKDKKRKSS